MMTVEPEAASKPRYLRVIVVDEAKEGRPVVKMRVPIGVVRFGFKMAQTFSPDLKKTNLDWDALVGMIDEGAKGELVHVEDEAEHKTIDVFVE